VPPVTVPVTERLEFVPPTGAADADAVIVIPFARVNVRVVELLKLNSQLTCPCPNGAIVPLKGCGINW